jgi:alkylated DNA repair protein (DNA oxidative demethylase)
MPMGHLNESIVLHTFNNKKVLKLLFSFDLISYRINVRYSSMRTLLMQLSLGLFENQGIISPGKGAVFLKGFACQYSEELCTHVRLIEKEAPFQKRIAPNGYPMSVMVSNCGQFGSLSSEKGYSYTEINPHTQKPWPKMPEIFLKLAISSAKMAGFPTFIPNSCHLNRYMIGAKLGLHTDKVENNDFEPVVTISLGLPATFEYGGLTRSAAKQKILLEHGDVMVWGGPARLNYHGVLPIVSGVHPLMGACRVSLVFRKVNL